MIDDELNDGEEEEFQEILFAEGYDEAILGVARQFDKMFVLYDYRKVMEIIQRDIPADEAQEYFEENMLGAWMGEATPAYLINKARDPLE